MSHSELAASSNQPQVLAPAKALSTHPFLLLVSPLAPGHFPIPSGFPMLCPHFYKQPLVQLLK